EQLAQEVEGLRVDGEYRVPVLLGRLLDRLRPDDAVREHEVIARTGHLGQHRAALARCKVGGEVGARKVAAEDIGAALPQDVDHRRSDAAGRAGDDGPLAVEPHSRAIRSRSWSMATAAMSSRLRTTSCQNETTLSSTSPLLMTPI